jgi:hypothetical protein
MKNILYVTAQPDVEYFHWQCEIYTKNFVEKGIKPEQIHIIFGMVLGNTEPQPYGLELEKKGFNVHYYLDTRERKHYQADIKPFLIYKWLKQYPEYGKIFFLHDADIIFRELPDMSNMLNDEICYMSDTRGYIGHNYLIDCCRRYESVFPNSYQNQLLDEMACVIDIPVNVIRDNQDSSGGGQYLLKNTSWPLWYKIYKNSSELYDQMLDYQKRFPMNEGQVQFWTAEMWSLLWNLWYFGIETKIDKKLDFCWATDDIKTYEKHNILHMAGVTENLRDTKFYKGDFIYKNPLDVLKKNINYFDYVDKSSSTIKYIELMKSIVKKS